MTTPYTYAGVPVHRRLNKSASANRPAVSPFALLDEHTKEAGWGDDIWNSTMKPIQNAGKQMLGGVGNAIGGTLKTIGNTVTAPMQTAWGGLKGGYNAVVSGGGLGDAAKGVIDGTWNGAVGAMNNAHAGSRQALGGVGNTLGGAAKTLWNTSPAGFMTNTAQGVATGASNAFQQTIDQRVQQGIDAHKANIQKSGATPQIWMGKSAAFAALGGSEMEKAAFTGLGKLVGRGVSRLGKRLFRSGRQAQQGARNKKYDKMHATWKDQPSNAGQTISRDSQQWMKEIARERTAGIGGSRMGSGKSIYDLGRRSQTDDLVARSLGIGTTAAAGGVGAAGLGMYGANRMGHSSGKEEGFNTGKSQGFDLGVDQGIYHTMANQPQDPGWLGRIADVFTGQERGIDPQQIQAMLAENKDSILSQLMQG